MYIFPASLKAEPLTESEQMLKVVEEVGEAAQCIYKGKPAQECLDELNDAVCAIEQLKRKVENRGVVSDEDSIARVRKKNARRGYWK